ncbi:hypothetical protein IEO21_09935 [Rhodonia placenta]|uniref:Uncharacterized protein n=1 Tax=Rhodonia placenta TaxID=104341 RepID=A0A8H7TX87_9APHY|nr:hypothetical protein IEO21_09935 [Postia placenta]
MPAPALVLVRSGQC